MSATDTAAASREIPLLKGLSGGDCTEEMTTDPARLMLRGYRELGPVYKIEWFGREQIVVAGPQAAMLLSTRLGKTKLRSKEFWQGFMDYMGVTKQINAEEGELHRKLQDVLRRGFSREAVAGQYHRLAEITDDALARDWPVGQGVPVVDAFQKMVVQQIGLFATGRAPLEYVKDIRVNIRTLMNVILLRQRPASDLETPEFVEADRRVKELSQDLLSEMKEHIKNDTLPDNLVGDIMRAHLADPDLIPESDLHMLLAGPYNAGLDTVANSVSSCLYGILKTPGVVEKVQEEADALFAKGTVTERDVRNLKYIQGCVNEALRLWPVAVAGMRAVVEDFEWEGYLLKKGDFILMGITVPHFMEEFYPEPEKFDPLRFSEDRKEHLKSGAFSPYSRGIHTCLGMNLAEVQMCLTMARVFHRYDLALPSPDYVLETVVDPNPGPSMDFKVKVLRERNPATPLTPEIAGGADATAPATCPHSGRADA